MNDMVVMQTLPEGHDRQKYLGGSDVAAIFGVSPWKTPLQLFQDKITPRTDAPMIDAEKAKFFARRKRQEPVIAEMLADEYGIVVTRLSVDDNPNRYLDSEFPFMAAEIDGEFLMSPSVRAAFPDRPEFCAIPDGTVLNLEFKTVHPFKASEWGEQGSEDVPIHYAAQVMHGLGVTQRPAAIVAALFGLDILLAFPVMRDEETITAMRAKAVVFWNEHVLQKRPPQPVSMDDMKMLYAGFKGKPAELSDDAFEALQALETLKKTMRQYAIDQSELEWRVARSIAFNWGVDIEPGDKSEPIIASTENAILMHGGVKAGSWNRQRGSFLDQKRLAADKPDLVAEYTKEHHYRVLRLKKGK